MNANSSNPIESKQKYQEYVDKKSPNSPIFKNCFNAFWVGGLICTIGQIISNICKTQYASPALLQSGNPLVGAYLARVETALIATVEGLTGAEKQRPERLAYFSQALHEIQEMRKHYGDNS